MRFFKDNEGNNLKLNKVEEIFSYFYSDFPMEPFFLNGIMINPNIFAEN